MIKTIRPKLEFLNEEFIKKIIDEGYDILEKEGVFVENQEALRLLKEAGMKVDESTQRVHITRALVEDSLSSTPSIIKLYDRTGDKEFIVGEDHVHFDPGSAAITILDHETSEERKPVSEDLVKLYRLTECLEHIHFQCTGIVSSDVPDIISDSYRMFLGLQFSTKPVVTGTFRVEGFKPMHDMLVAIRGCEDALAEKPLAIFDACPSPPLKWSNLTAQSLIGPEHLIDEHVHSNVGGIQAHVELLEDHIALLFDLPQFELGVPDDVNQLADSMLNLLRVFLYRLGV